MNLRCPCLVIMQIILGSLMTSASALENCFQDCTYVGSLFVSSEGMARIIENTIRSRQDHIQKQIVRASHLPIQYQYRTPDACMKENPPKDLTCIKLPTIGKQGELAIFDLKLRPIDFKMSDGRIRHIDFELAEPPKCQGPKCQVKIQIKALQIESEISLRDIKNDKSIISPHKFRLVSAKNKDGQYPTMNFEGTINSQTGELEDLVKVRNVGIDLPPGTFSLKAVRTDQMGRELNDSQYQSLLRQEAYASIQPTVMRILKEPDSKWLKGQVEEMTADVDLKPYGRNVEKTKARLRQGIVDKLRENLKSGQLPKTKEEQEKFMANFPPELFHVPELRNSISNRILDVNASLEGFRGSEGEYRWFAMGQMLAEGLFLNDPEFMKSLEGFIEPHFDSLKTEINNSLSLLPDYINQSPMGSSLSKIPMPSGQDFSDRAKLYERLYKVRETATSTSNDKTREEMWKRIEQIEGAIGEIDNRISNAYGKLDLAVMIDKASDVGTRGFLYQKGQQCKPNLNVAKADKDAPKEDISLDLPISAFNKYLKSMHAMGNLQACLKTPELDGKRSISRAHHDKGLDTSSDYLKNCDGTMGAKLSKPPVMSYANGKYTVTIEDAYLDGSKVNAKFNVIPELCNNGVLCLKVKDPEAHASGLLWLFGAGGHIEAAISSVSRNLATEGLPRAAKIPNMDLNNVQTFPDGTLRLGWNFKSLPPERP